MIDKRTFTRLLNSLEKYVSGLQDFETSLNVTFDNNFMTCIIDNTLNTLAESFFTEEELNDLEKCFAIETVKDIIYHYALTAEFGLKASKLKRIYVEDEGLDTEFALDACNEEELYAVVTRYLNPPRVCKTYLINC